MRAHLLSRIPRGWILSLLAPALLGGCAHHPNKTKVEAKQVGMKEVEYRKLKTDAESGDQKAAERLAQLWYQWGDDNTQALYWLDLAAKNGSEKAAKLAHVAKSELEQ